MNDCTIKLRNFVRYVKIFWAIFVKITPGRKIKICKIGTDWDISKNPRRPLIHS